MYKNFNQTADGGYSLKKQGMMTTVLVAGAFIILTGICLNSYFTTQQNNKLLFALLMFGFSLILIWRSTKKFIIYPSRKVFKYAAGIGICFQEFHFFELDGATQEKIKNKFGITTGTTLKLGFQKNGKYKEILLGQNISAEKMRSISEEISQIMTKN